MKTLLLALSIVFFSLANARCQGSYIHPPAIGLHIIFNQFNTIDSAVHYPANPGHLKTGLAIDYLKGLSPRIDFDLNVSGSFQRFPGQDGQSNQHLFLEPDASLIFNLLPATSRINPFFRAGLGVYKFSNYCGAYIPVGVGMRVTMPGETFLLLQCRYHIPSISSQAEHLQISLGIAGIIGKWRKTKSQPARQTARSVVHNSGGKDSDGDGIVDSLDACPTIPGSARYQGCPVPDRDKDGVNDEEDKCPDLPGSRSNQGCPILTKSIQRKVEWDAKNVYFQTDSFALLPASSKALHDLAGILRQNPGLKLSIEGHTDNTGTDQWNRTLSERRAASVMQYLTLIEKIDPARLTSAGYGSTRPVAENTTAEGKALNRRVEFKLRYF